MEDMDIAVSMLSSNQRGGESIINVMERLWREEDLKVPQRQPKRGRLYLNDGSYIRLRPCWQNHIWSYDFGADRLFNGKKIRMLTLIDEYTRTNTWL